MGLTTPHRSFLRVKCGDTQSWPLRNVTRKALALTGRGLRPRAGALWVLLRCLRALLVRPCHKAGQITQDKALSYGGGADSLGRSSLWQVAQTVERLIVNQDVVGSIPTLSAIAGLAQWSCRGFVNLRREFNSLTRHQFLRPPSGGLSCFWGMASRQKPIQSHPKRPLNNPRVFAKPPQTEKHLPL